MSGQRGVSSPRAPQPPNTAPRAPPSRPEAREDQDPELRPLTSGPGGDGLPGMRLVIGGVVTVQVHPVVIRVDLGGSPVPLWRHLIGGTSWRLESKQGRQRPSPTPAPPTTEELGPGHLPSCHRSQRAQGHVKSHHIHSPPLPVSCESCRCPPRSACLCTAPGDPLGAPWLEPPVLR